MQRTFGPKYPDVVSSHNNLATVLCDQGDLKEAKEYRKSSAANRQQTLGPQRSSVCRLL